MCVLHFNADLQDFWNFNQHISSQFPCIWFLFVSPLRLQVWYLLWTFGGSESWRQLPYVDSREHFILQSSQKISVCLSEPSVFKLKHLSGSVSEAHPAALLSPSPRVDSGTCERTWWEGLHRGLQRRSGAFSGLRKDLDSAGCRIQTN